MGRAPCGRVQSEEGFYKGPWTEEEDAVLIAFINANGEGNWRTLPNRAGRKSCRLRWMNYLRPNLKRGNFSPEVDELIIKLHSLLGNRLSSMESDSICQKVVATPLSIASLESSIKVEVEISCSRLDSGESSSPGSVATNLSSHFTTPEARDQEASLLSDARDISNFPEFAIYPSVIRQGEAITSTPSSHGTAWSEDDDWDCWPPLEEIAERSTAEQKPPHAQLPESGPFHPAQSRVDISYFGDGILDFEYDTQEMSNSHKLMHFALFSPLQSMAS